MVKEELMAQVWKPKGNVDGNKWLCFEVMGRIEC